MILAFSLAVRRDSIWYAHIYRLRRYPDTMPRCRFFTTVLHPEVRDQELDLSPHAKEWSTSKYKLICVRSP